MTDVVAPMPKANPKSLSRTVSFHGDRPCSRHSRESFSPSEHELSRPGTGASISSRLHSPEKSTKLPDIHRASCTPLAVGPPVSPSNHDTKTRRRTVLQIVLPGADPNDRRSSKVLTRRGTRARASEETVFSRGARTPERPHSTAGHHSKLWHRLASRPSMISMPEVSSSSDEDENVEGPHYGMLMDMVHRTGVGGGAQCMKAFLEHMKGGAPSVFEYTKDALLRDEFQALLWEDLTRFYKDKKAVKAGGKGTPWQACTAEHIRTKVRNIVALKRDVCGFRKEVHNWLLSYKLLNTYVPSRFESVRERQNRMDEFWQQYHKKLRRNNLPPIVQGSGSPSHRNHTSISPGHRSKPMCFADKDQWNMIALIEDQNKNQRKRDRGDSCTTLETHPRHGMKFRSDAGTGKMTWTMVNPAEGTRAALKQGSSERREGVGMGNKSASEPTLKKAPDKLRKLEKQQSAALSRRSVLNAGGSFLPAIKRIGEPQLSNAPTNSYVETCQRCWIVPTPLPFVTGHSWRLQAAGRNMLDNDLRAVASMLQEVGSIEEIDLSDNVLLTEKALVPFLQRLYGEPAASTLQRLTLRGVKNIGIKSMDVIGKLIADGDGLRNLRTLDISRVRATPKCHLKLAQAIKEHGAVEAINLCDTNLGNNSWIAKQCVNLLMGESVRTLDLSWNCFDVEVFRHLGETVVKRKKIQALSIANCGSATISLDTAPAITFFLECLSRDVSLTYLDVSLNRMDFRAMLILEDGLEYHPTLQKLELSENPLGIFGMRSALRLLTRTHNRIVHFESHLCFGGTSLVDGAQVFNMTNPSGRYTLQLERPYHRCILRMLYKQCERFKCPVNQAFVSVSYSKPPWVHATKTNNTFEVPTEGTLACVFNIEAFVENRITNISDDDFTGFLDTHRRLTKIQPPWSKIIPLFAVWKQLDGKTMDQSVFLNAMAKDFCLTPSMLEHMCESSPIMRSEVLYRLLPAVVGGKAMESLCMMLFTSAGEFIRMHRCMRAFLDFNIENPTGHYKLDLGKCTDYSVAEMLLLLDEWEVVIGRRQNRKDISQRGNLSHVRNELYQAHSLHHIPVISEWTLPEVDEFECDYVSGKRCAPDAVIIDEETFESMLVSLYDAACTPIAKLEALRLVSHHIHLTSKQMREMLGCFKAESHRAEAFVTFFLRIVDVWNGKVFRVRFSDERELKKLQERMGYCIFFPFIQPENAKFELDYQYHDQRLCGNIVLKLATQEGLNNVHDPQFIHPDGTIDPLPLGVPRTWETFERMPKNGVFKATYNCAPENRKFVPRKHLAETFASFTVPVEEKNVMWWTGLQEPPEDVLEWLEFCIGNFKNMQEAFTAIDGEGGNGVITLREFEDGLRECNCEKFKGKDEQHRIAALFRYLDPGGEGTVSREEWGILDQLWKEFELCIYEFVAFLSRMFGPEPDVWWSFLDNDASGELTMDEWMVAVQDIGYFGPAKCVFSLLDNSDDGNISLDEFMVLEKYKLQKKVKPSHS